MSKFLNPRRSSHRGLCYILAMLTAASPSLAVAQQTIEVQEQTDVPVIDQPDPSVTRTGDTSLLADPKPGPGNAQPVDLAYAVPNSFVFVALRPAQILNSPMAEFYPTEVLQAAGVQELGVDPLTLEQVVFAVAPTIGGPPSYSAMAKFTQPLRMKASKITAHTVPADLAGKKYLQSQNPTLPSLHRLDDESLLIAPDYFLRALVAAKEPPKVTNLSAAFAAADQGDDLLAMIDVSQFRALANMLLSQAPVPPEFQSLKQIPNLIKFIELRANVSHPGPTSLIVTANNEADADKLLAIVDQMKQLAASAVAAEAQKQLQSQDPVEQANGRYMLRMSKLSNERLQLERRGDQIILFRADFTGEGSNPMVATATIGVLVALLLPAVQAAREAARRNTAMNNMKQIMLAMLVHESEHKAFPPYASFGADGKPLLGWRVHILPYLEQQQLYEKFHLDEPWDSEHNKQLIPLMPEVFFDPSSKLAPADGKTHYLGVTGAPYFFDGTRDGRSLKDIEDGTADTIALVQVDDDHTAIWTKPAGWSPDAKDLKKGTGRLHQGDIFLAAFSDGSVKVVSQNVDPLALMFMLTVAGGERLNDP